MASTSTAEDHEDMAHAVLRGSVVIRTCILMYHKRKQTHKDKKKRFMYNILVVHSEYP